MNKYLDVICRKIYLDISRCHKVIKKFKKRRGDVTDTYVVYSILTVKESERFWWRLIDAPWIKIIHDKKNLLLRKGIKGMGQFTARGYH